MKKDLHNLLKAARLYYNENLTQQEVAGRMNTSRIKVHRMLTTARERGLVEITIQEPAEDYSEQEIFFENTYGLKECVIVPSRENNDDIYREMAVSLTEILERDLRPGDYAGIGWGTTIRGVADYLTFSKKYEVNIMPMAGGLGHSTEKLHSNSITALVASKIGGKGFVLNCPFIVENEQAKSLFLNEPSVRELLSLRTKISVALVSLSHLGDDMTVRRLGLFTDADCRYLAGLGVIGDVNAVFIDEEGHPVVNDLQNRIINVPVKELFCARNIIGVAFGVKKAPVIRAALKSRMIHTLITDKRTADAVAENSEFPAMSPGLRAR